MQPGSAPWSCRQDRDSFGQPSRHTDHSMSPRPRVTERPLSQLTEFVNPFADNPNSANNTVLSAFPPPPTLTNRGRRPNTTRRKSEATSLSGGILPSEKSGSLSLTGTSIVDSGPPIDTGDWDDAVARRREEDMLFYTQSSGASGSNAH